jgi:membrane protein DedA with SNARE-associated domain
MDIESACIPIPSEIIMPFSGYLVSTGRFNLLLVATAGAVGCPQLRFQTYTIIGSWPWCFGLAYIGFKLGKRWNSDPRLQAIMHRLGHIVLLLIVLAVAWYVCRHLQRSREEPE